MNSPPSNLFRCENCDIEFPNKVLFGRHHHRYHAEDSDSVSEDDLCEIDTKFGSTGANGGSQNSSFNTVKPNKEVVVPLPTNETDAAQFEQNLPPPTHEVCNPFLVSSVPSSPQQVALRNTFQSLNSPGICFDVIDFYEFFCDKFEELYPNVKSIKPPLNDLCAATREVLQYCTQNQLTLGESAGVFNLVKKLEELNAENVRPVSSQFHNEGSFVVYLDTVRKQTVKHEGWRRALIKTDFGLNKTGVFRPVKPLLFDVIEKAGGLEAIIPFRETHVHGRRVFYAAWNTRAIEQYQSCFESEGKLVLIDVYSDGLAMSSSGTQSVNNMRVRFPNITGQSKKWHDVGIVPIVDTQGETKSDNH